MDFSSDDLTRLVHPSNGMTADSIVSPGGDHRRPSFFAKPMLRGRTLGVCTLTKVGLLSLVSPFGFFGIVDFGRHLLEDLLGRNLPNIHRKIIEIQFLRLENQALEPPKSSPEPSKTPFLKDI